MDRTREHFEATLEAPGAVRSFVRSALADVAVVDEVVLAANELATNAVVHGGTGFDVVVEREDDGVRVVVIDGSDDVPVPGDAPDDAVGGRGLRLVEATADEWGVRIAPPGKEVWFHCRFERHPSNRTHRGAGDGAARVIDLTDPVIDLR